MQKHKTWDGQGLFRTGILVSFHLFFLWLIVSGNSIRYLSLLLSPFLYFAAVAFLLLAIVQFKKSRVETHHHTCECGHHHHDPKQSLLKKVGSYGLIVLPLLLAIVVPYQVPTSALAAQKRVQTGTTPNSTAAVQAATDPSSSEDDPERKAADELKKKDKIVVNDDNYFTVLNVLDQYPDEFVGKDIQIKGVVYADPDAMYKKKEIGRVLIVCCFADATFYGIPIINNSIEKYKQDTWLSIEGTIDKMKADGEVIACIKAKKMKKTTAPKDPYIYPNM